LTSPRRLRGPIPCTDCHRVPEALESDGHIDDPTPAEVFPGGASFGGLAAAGGAVPDYDFEAGTCADVYCHGGGDVLAGDRSPDLLRTPVWNALDQGQVACGTCHGVPPQDGSHAPELTFRDCAECHTSVDAFGNVIVRNGPDGPTSQHIDGDIDVR
jgi:predicted CxxxxCH...CXXCH cytochrome family protein